MREWAITSGAFLVPPSDLPPLESYLRPGAAVVAPSPPPATAAAIEPAQVPGPRAVDLDHPTRAVMPCTLRYQLWLKRFARRLGLNQAQALDQGIRRLAEASGQDQPPPRLPELVDPRFETHDRYDGESWPSRDRSYLETDPDRLKPPPP